MKLKFLAAGMLAAVAVTANAQNLNGAGATFPNPIYSKWFSEYSAAHSGVHINYQPVGSGAGIQQVTSGIVDFGASDLTMNDQQLGSSKVKLVHIPTVLGAVVPIYNLQGVTKELNFSGDVLADIYLGKIKTWNDPRIAKDNAGVSLPAKPILPVYRSEGSGTTFIFTDYLSKVSPDWASSVGKNSAVTWKAGIGEKGSEGVAGMVRQTPNSIGYVELVYAVQNHIAYGLMKNADGKFVRASVESVTAAAAAAAKTMPQDYRVSITNAPGAASYPISSFTWLLIPTQSADPAKGKVLKEFLTWMLDKGEAEAAGLTYAPLPAAVQAMERKTIATLK